MVGEIVSLEAKIKIGVTIHGIGKIEDVYNEQVQIAGQWYHLVVVFEALVRKVSFDKLREVCNSANPHLIRAAYQYVVELSGEGSSSIKEKFGNKVVNGIVNDFDWLKSNLCSAYSRVCGGEHLNINQAVKLE